MGHTAKMLFFCNGLRRGEFDVLIGINLLREGLDLPEVSLVAILDADNVPSSYSYNIRGFKTGSNDADTGSWTLTPDSLNELVSQKDANGQVTTFGYDLLGRMTSRT